MGAAALSPDMLTCQNGWNYNGLPPSCNALSQFGGWPAKFLLINLGRRWQKTM